MKRVTRVSFPKTLFVASILSPSQVYVLPSIEAVLIFILIPLNAWLNPIINTITTSEFWPIKQYIFNSVKKTLHAIHIIAQLISKTLRALKIKYDTRPEILRPQLDIFRLGKLPPMDLINQQLK